MALLIWQILVVEVPAGLVRQRNSPFWHESGFSGLGMALSVEAGLIAG